MSIATFWSKCKTPYTLKVLSGVLTLKIAPVGDKTEAWCGVLSTPCHRFYHQEIQKLALQTSTECCQSSYSTFLEILTHSNYPGMAMQCNWYLWNGDHCSVDWQGWTFPKNMVSLVSIQIFSGICKIDNYMLILMPPMNPWSRSIYSITHYTSLIW